MTDPDATGHGVEAGPRSLRDGAVRADKLARLHEPPVAALNALAERWRRQDPDRSIPWFDPDGAGVAARVLVLMEAPGPRTARDAAGGLCSEDNDDATAAVLHRLRQQAGLRRQDYLRWNIVPWAVHGPEGHWTAPTDRDLAAASTALGDLLSHLPELRLVICMGAKALTGLMRHLTLSDQAPLPLVLGVPHPSQRNTRARDEAVRRIENALCRAHDVVQA